MISRSREHLIQVRAVGQGAVKILVLLGSPGCHPITHHDQRIRFPLAVQLVQPRH